MVPNPWTVRAYRILARLLLPPSLRGGYEAGQTQLAADLIAQARTGAGYLAAVGAFGREVRGLLHTGWEERRRSARERRRKRHRDREEPASVRHMITVLVQDVRFAVRRLAKSRGMTLAAVATLALGIGANTAIFTVVSGVLVHTLPYPDPSRVVYLTETNREGDPRALSYDNFRDWQRENEVFEDIVVWVGNSTNVTGDGQPERIRGMFVTASYFTVAGVHPAMGRPILPGEDEPGAPRTTVLSHGFWQRRFGGDPEILGKTIMLNNESHAIVGVMPADFAPIWDTADAWISFHTVAGWTLDRASKNLQAMARLKAGVTVQQAQEDMNVIQSRLREAYPDVNEDRGVLVRELAPLIRRSQRTTVLTLVAAAGMVLLIGCANVANLQLASATGRVREMGIRAALGGSRRRLAAQMLIENLTLALVGGLMGLGMSFLGVDLLLSLRPSYGEIYDVAVNGWVLVFGMVLAVLTGIAFGLLPAIRAARTDLLSAFKEGARGTSASSGTKAVRGGLVVVQMAMAVTLLVGAGLLIRSLAELRRVEPGFDTENLLTLEFRLPVNKYDEPEKMVAFFDGIVVRARAVPGAVAVASAGSLPFSWNGGFGMLFREGDPPERENGFSVQTNAVSPGYFETMRIPLLQGRVLEDTDRAGTPLAGVLSRDAAERLWPGESPLGRRIYVDETDSVATIVGVVGEVRLDVTADPVPHVYYSYAQRPSILASLVVRTSSDPMSLASSARDAIWAVDPDQPVWEIMPISERITGSIASRRFLMVLLAVFAAVALVLGSIGIYGVMGYSVNQRAGEIGVRLALGARGAQIRRMILKQGVGLALVGVAIGLAAAAGLTRILTASLFGISPLDPATFFIVPVVLASVAALACYLPAHRATKVDPVQTLQDV